MTERPILFSGEMVRAILEGRKTQTRRVMKPQPDTEFPCVYDRECLYGIPGDRLWVREAFSIYDHPEGPVCFYKADHPQDEYLKWRPSIHMPRWVSKILLEITDIRVERLKDISEEDAKAEGVVIGVEEFKVTGTDRPYKLAYSLLWDLINAKRGFGWDVNPWVWVIEFKRVGK